MVRRLGLGKNNHLTYASLALNPRTVILVKKEYEDKVILMLSDDKTYEQFCKDPTPKYI